MVLCIDVIFVNRVALLITVSRIVLSSTVHGLTSIKILVLEKAIKDNAKLYVVRGFMIKFILVNLHFKAINDRNNIDWVNINIASRDEYAKDTERYN